ncbi:Blue-light-activated protein [Lacunisphaera limnophila]|uniref:histidine kinase n=1 Tax=Lacunisphaera limnophila TaxID=1838286 RepID=A0A1D8AV80_9BACT|nr:PAS domain S-box protein [Lacunisphaera limnophila]AOS44746.1 Blue-light-activated protein [Lacunisphaera limnophila]
MRRIAVDTLRARLAQLIVVAVLLAIFVTVSVLAVYEVTTFRPRVLSNAKAQADLIAEIIVPALEFNDAGTARKQLSVLRHESIVVAAGVYLADGSLLADYQKDGTAVVVPVAAPPQQDRIDGQKVLVSVKVKSEGVEIGRVWLQASLPGWAYRVRQYGPLFVVVAVIVLGLSLFIVWATRRQITDPIQSLVETVRRISVSQDLALRVPEKDQGELGALARSFNEMLGAIGQRDQLLRHRDARLVRHNAGLAQLSRADLVDESGFTQALRGITSLAADIQEAERVSVWFLDESMEAIQCIDLFVRASRSHTAGGRLTRADYPFYFGFLDKGRVLEVCDASQDERTREFAPRYLEQHRVGAMLDVPILWRGEIVGVLCHEHVGAARSWHADETALAVAFAERIAHLLERRSTLRADAALRESEARYRDFIAQAQDAIFTLSLDGRIQSVNDAARRVTGWELNTWVGHRFQRVLLPEDLAVAEQRFAAVIAGESPPSFELRIRARDGGLVTLEFAVSPQLKEGRVIGLLGIGRDVTERNRAEETQTRLEAQLRQAQKMEAIGNLAGGIAHDFNNILTAIIGHTQLAEMDLPLRHPARDALVNTLAASHRAKELVNQILAFSRKQEPKRVLLHLGLVVQESLKLLRPVLPSSIEIVTRLPEGLPGIMGDATQMHQVLVNLATNAAQVMAGQGGRLELAVEFVVVDQAMVQQRPQLRPGSFLRLLVSDTGSGMDEQTLQRIFEPFFTTKAPGQGTGLGLAVVHGIVQAHEGAIVVYSQPGQGTAFHLYFPAVAVTDTAARTPPALPVAAAVAGEGRSIMLVDDDSLVLLAAEKVLRRAGYRVMPFGDPEAALRAFQTSPTECDLIVTDLTMPRMLGTKLAAECRALRSDLPVLLTTGFGGALDRAALDRAGVVAMVQKPFTSESLLRAVAEAMVRPG